jgi:hypothetical protein
MAGKRTLAEVEREIGRLSGLPRAALRAEWRTLLGSEPPNVSRDLLLRALAWELQAQVLGGLSKETKRILAGQRATARVAKPTPGTCYVREWRGEAQVVSVASDGSLIWKDQRFQSLSAAARAITGTRWSGPAFFGLKGKAA